MVLVVTGVGFLIHVYAIGYMRGDPGYARFFALMNIFVLAMLMLVLAGNFLLLVVGWGGVGFASYALIAFWFQKPENAAAGTKAFVVNSIGDAGLLLAIFLIFINFGRLDYTGVFSQASQKLAFDGPVVTAIALLLLIGAAQVGTATLHVWLPMLWRPYTGQRPDSRRDNGDRWCISDSEGSPSLYDEPDRHAGGCFHRCSDRAVRCDHRSGAAQYQESACLLHC